MCPCRPDVSRKVYGWHLGSVQVSGGSHVRSERRPATCERTDQPLQCGVVLLFVLPRGPRRLPRLHQEQQREEADVERKQRLDPRLREPKDGGWTDSRAGPIRPSGSGGSASTMTVPNARASARGYRPNGSPTRKRGTPKSSDMRRRRCTSRAAPRSPRGRTTTRPTLPAMTAPCTRVSRFLPP